MLVPAVLSILAGLVTTVAGLGGGFFLLLGLSVVWSPAEALVVTGPALLVGNAHRFWVFRHDVQWRLGTLSLGTFVGAVIGGLFAMGVPDQVLKGTMLGMTGLLLVKQLAGLEAQIHPRWLPLIGVGVGGVAATGGGGGVLSGPVLKGAGAVDGAYIGTMAMSSCAIHLGRMLGYTSAGGMATRHLWMGAGLALCVMLGNRCGLVLRDHLSKGTRRGVEVVALAACTGLALLS